MTDAYEMESSHEGCGCSRCAGKSSGKLIRIVVNALEDSADEADFLEQVAAETGGFGALPGILGSLWSRIFGPKQKVSQGVMLPPKPKQPPGPPYDQPIPKPPKLPGGGARFEREAEVGDGFAQAANGFDGFDGIENELEDDFESDLAGDFADDFENEFEDDFEEDFEAEVGPPSSDAPTLPRPFVTSGDQVPPTLRSGVPPSDRTRLAAWLTDGLVRRGTPQARGIRVNGFDGYEAVVEAAIEEDELEAASPVLAGLALKRLLPQISQLPPELRQRLVGSLSGAIRSLSQRAGSTGARAAPGLLQSVARVAQQKGLPAQALAPALQRLAPAIAQQSDLVQRFAAAARRANATRTQVIRRMGT